MFLWASYDSDLSKLRGRGLLKDFFIHASQNALIRRANCQLYTDFVPVQFAPRTYLRPYLTFPAYSV